MMEEDFNELKKIVGKKVVEIRADTDSYDYGFDIVFSDGKVLEIYDLACNGGLAFCVSNEQRDEEEKEEEEVEACWRFRTLQEEG